MLAIIREESDNLNSNLAKNNNNLAGMKLPKKRETTAIKADYRGFSIYETQSDSVDDLAIYIDKYITPKGLSRKEALKFLEKNYAMTNGYANRLYQLL